MIVFAETTERTEHLVTSHRYDVAHGDGKIPVDRRTLRQVTDAPAGLAAGHATDGDAARRQAMPAKDGAQQRAFARAVGAHQRDQ